MRRTAWGRWERPYEERWLVLFAAARLAATAFAAALLMWSGPGSDDLLLLLYGPVSTALLVALPRLRELPVVWVADSLAALALIAAAGDWRSPFYLLWLATLALPATSLPLRRALLLAFVAPLAFLVVAVVGGPSPGDLEVRSAETLAIHLSLPLLLVAALAYAGHALRRLTDERRERERLAIDAERRRIAWELHDSAKQRLSAAHLLVSSLHGRVGPDLDQIVSRAAVELESAGTDMDTSLAELRSPLEGRPLDEALRSRARELAPTGSPRIEVEGAAPPLPPLVVAHLYRIGCEAITNALRHADATSIRVRLERNGSGLRMGVVDDGRGLPPERRHGATGLIAMESRAATIGARLAVGEGPEGRGTAIWLDVPTTRNGGRP
jgi:signal transduction histidine kinase